MEESGKEFTRLDFQGPASRVSLRHGWARNFAWRLIAKDILGSSSQLKRPKSSIHWFGIHQIFFHARD